MEVKYKSRLTDCIPVNSKLRPWDNKKHALENYLSEMDGVCLENNHVLIGSIIYMFDHERCHILMDRSIVITVDDSKVDGDPCHRNDAPVILIGVQPRIN